jgi:DNA replication protein DnaC
MLAHSMSAFLKLDRCTACGSERPWEWVPPVAPNGRPLAGTGVWRSTLVDGRCAPCTEKFEFSQERARLSRNLRERFIRVVGGAKPYRDFTFESFLPSVGNRAALATAKSLIPARQNLYVWGTCGVGKTHLAVAILRRWFSRGASAVMTTPAQLVRRLRMRPPDEEQRVMDELVRVNLLLVDDLGAGGESAFTRQVLQEVIDGRHFADRGGLIVTSLHSTEELARSRPDASLASRLAGMCQIVRVFGPDHRRRLGSQGQRPS